MVTDLDRGCGGNRLTACRKRLFGLLHARNELQTIEESVPQCGEGFKFFGSLVIKIK